MKKLKIVYSETIKKTMSVFVRGWRQDYGSKMEALIEETRALNIGVILRMDKIIPIPLDDGIVYVNTNSEIPYDGDNFTFRESLRRRNGERIYLTAIETIHHYISQGQMFL